MATVCPVFNLTVQKDATKNHFLKWNNYGLFHKAIYYKAKFYTLLVLGNVTEIMYC